MAIQGGVARLLDPRAKQAVIQPELARDLTDAAAAFSHQSHRFRFELR